MQSLKKSHGQGQPQSRKKQKSHHPSHDWTPQKRGKVLRGKEETESGEQCMTASQSSTRDRKKKRQELEEAGNIKEG